MTAFLLPRAVGGGLRRAGRSIRGLPVSALAEPLRSYILIVTSLAIGVCSFVAAWSQWKPDEVLIFAGVIACGFVAIESTRTVRQRPGTVGRHLSTACYPTSALALPPIYPFLAPDPFNAYTP